MERANEGVLDSPEKRRLPMLPDSIILRVKVVELVLEV